MPGPIVKKSLGPSKLGSAFGTNWNNLHRGVYGPIKCEICGKIHPSRLDETYTISRFLGLQVVEKCCGAMLDKVYKESGEEFAIRFLEELAENPTDPRFSIVLIRFGKIIQRAYLKAVNLCQKSKRMSDQLLVVKEAKMKLS